MPIAIIGGTGIDEIGDLQKGEIINISTRFGDADIIKSQINKFPVYFLPRHGVNHSLIPSQINYRAQIAAIKKLSIQNVIGVCAVGSLVDYLDAGSFAVLADFIDFTKRRKDTFFDEPGSPVAHVDFTFPYCPKISSILLEACNKVNVVYEPKAIYIGVEGPRYESPAEIRLFRSWGAHVVGMTNLPEVVLAKEAGLCYGAIAVITNKAAGLTAEPLSHDDVRAAMNSAKANLLNILSYSISIIDSGSDCYCSSNNYLIL